MDGVARLDHASMPADTPPRGAERERVHALLRGLEVLRAFTREAPALTLSEVAARTGLTRASARRFLLTFVDAGYAETDGRRFRLTPRLLELGTSVLAGADIWDIARPILSQVAERMGESCFGAVLDGADALYVLHIPNARHVVHVGLRVGSRLPATCTSVGRVLLAGLGPDAVERVLAAARPQRFTPRTQTGRAELRAAVDTARRQGWALVDEELEVGLRSISVPLRSRGGLVLGALNICAPTARVSLDALRGPFLTALQGAAQQIRAALP